MNIISKCLMPPALVVLVALLAGPVVAQDENGSQGQQAPIVVNAQVVVNGPDGAPDGHNAPTTLIVRGGRGGDGGIINANSGNGGGLEFRAGNAGNSSQDAGNGGGITFIAGQGGGSSELPGNGGSIVLQTGGTSGCGIACGRPGNIILAVHSRGAVGVGTSTPSNTLEVVAGGSTLADSWSVRSSRRSKVNILPLVGALAKVEQLQGVSYQRKADGKREIGVVAEDVDQVMPEVVSRNPQTKEVQGVDYSRLTALLIEAVKEQQTEIQRLRSEVERRSSSADPTHQ